MAHFFFFPEMGSQFDVGVYLFQVTRPVQSLGVQEELLLVSLVLEVVVLIALARVLLEMYPFSPHQDLNFSLLMLCKSDQCSKALCWWCNLHLTLWPVTVACCQYAGTYGWWATVSGQVQDISGPTLTDWSDLLDFTLDVSWRSHVCPHQNLAPLAPQDQHNPETLCHLLCCGCFCHSCSCDVQG